MDFANYWFSAAAGGGGYEIDNSLRFRESQYLQRTQVAPTDRKKLTISFWAKLAGFGTVRQVFSSGNSTSAIARVQITSGDKLDSLEQAGSSLNTNTNALLRDPSAWYHVLIKEDFTQATTSDRIQIYLNGELQAVSLQTPAQNSNSQYSRSGERHRIGEASWSTTSDKFDGYLAEFHFIDGTALAPTDFGEFNANGVWVPIDVTGVTYGNNGFYLDFSDAADIGADRSGNGNNFTPTNFELTDTQSVDYDWVEDSPTNNSYTFFPEQFIPLGYASSGATRTVEEANTASKVASSTANDWRDTFGYFTQTLPSSGKWVIPFVSDMYGLDAGSGRLRHPGVYVTNEIRSLSESNLQPSAYGSDWAYGLSVFQRHDATNRGAYTTAADGTTGYDNNNYNGISATPYPQGLFVIAWDGDAGDLWLGHVYRSPGDSGYTGDIRWYQPDATFSTTFNPATPFASGIDPAFKYISTRTGVYLLNASSAPQLFQSESQYSAWGITSGSDPLNNGFALMLADTFGAPAPIAKPSDHFTTILDTGANILTNAQATFSNGLWWIKDRANSNNHQLVDSVRGGTLTLKSNASNSEGAYVAPAGNSVAWCWKAGGTAVTNNDGSITSQVSANPTAGFSIVSYVGNNTAGATIGHGLGAKPDFIVVKDRDSAAGWQVYHSELGATQYIILNSTNGASTQTNRWNDTEPTSTVFSVGTAAGTNGSSGNDYIAYCFAEVEGYSKFGSYTGNGSTDGPFVHCGFRPAWVMIKRFDSTNSWYILDSTRDPFNVCQAKLQADQSVAETVDTNNEIDFLSNGFKMRRTQNGTNGLNAEYVYMAVAEYPFGGANVSPSPAR